MRYKLRVLKEDERVRLEIQFLNTPDPAESFSASGEHYILADILNQLGYHPNSREEVYRLAEALLCYTGENDDEYYSDFADKA